MMNGMPEAGGRTLFVVSPRGERGPIDRAELRELLKQQEIEPTDQVRTAFGRPLGTVAEVLRARTSDRPPASTTPPESRRAKPRGLPVPVIVGAIAGALLLAIIIAVAMAHGQAAETPAEPVATPPAPVQPTQPHVSHEPSLIPNARPADLPLQAGLTPGLIAEFFRDTGESGKIPDFATMTPAFRHIEADINVLGEGPWPGTDLADCFGIRWTGFLRVPSAGNYSLALSSDDGSQLFLDGRKLILNDGLHGMEELSWSGQLTAGDHALIIDFVQGHGPRGCQLVWWSDESGRKVIPAANLLHKTDPALDGK